MDSYTFGNSRGAVNLMTMLQKEENSCYRPLVSAILGKFYQSTGDIMAIPSSSTRVAVLNVWHKRFVDRVSHLAIPDAVRTHTLCVLKTRYRQCMKGACKRCHRIRDDNVDSDICGSCADVLGEDEAARAIDGAYERRR